MNVPAHRVLAALGLASLVALGFAQRAPERASAADRSQTAPPAPHAPLPSPAEHGTAGSPAAAEHGVRAPLVVTLADGNTDPATGEREVRVFLDAPADLAFPVELRASAPRGAVITAGEAKQTLPIKAGRATLSFTLRGEAPTEQNPFRVVVHGESAGGVMGLHADRTLPPSSELTVPPPAGPRPPGGRPPGPASR